MRPLLVFDMNLRDRGDHHADWSHHGDYTADERTSCLHSHELAGYGADHIRSRVHRGGGQSAGERQYFSFDQPDGVIVVRDLPESFDTTMKVVLRFAVADRRASTTTAATAIRRCPTAGMIRLIPICRCEMQGPGLSEAGE